MSNFPGVYRRGDRYAAMPYNPATKAKLYLGTRDTDKEAYALILEWESGGKRSQNPSINAIRDEWLALHVENLSPTTRGDYTHATARLAERFGHESPDDLYDQFAQVGRWGASVSTSVVETCFAMIEWARKRRMCKVNPLEGVAGRPQAKREQKVILTEAQVRELADLCFEVHREPKATAMASLILTHYGTMLRPAHLFKLHGRDLMFARNRILAPAVKRGREQEVAMLPIAREGFEMLGPIDGDQLVYTNSRGNRLQNSTVHNWFDPVRRAYGVPQMWFYDLKSSQTVRLKVEGKADFAVLAKQATHSDNGETLSRNYTQIAVEDALREVERADSVATARRNTGLSVAESVPNRLGAA